MNKYNLKLNPSYADKSNQQKAEEPMNKFCEDEFLFGSDHREDYVEISKQWASKKFKSLQKIEESNELGKCILNLFIFHLFQANTRLSLNLYIKTYIIIQKVDHTIRSSDILINNI